MAARAGEGLAEVADQGGRLTAGLGDQRQDLLDPRDLMRFAALEALDKHGHQRVRVDWRATAGGAGERQPRLVRAELDRSLLFQVMQRAQYALTLSAERARHHGRIQAVPGAALLRRPEQPLGKAPRLT